MGKRGVYLFIFILALNLVSASTIEFERDSYYPGETLQAKLDFNFSLQKPLTQSNIQFIRDDSALKISPFIKQVDNNSYYLYFQIPANSESGVYGLDVNDVYYFDAILKTVSVTNNISIINLDKDYKYLLDNQNADGSFGNVMETSLAAIVLKDIGYTNNSDKAVLWILNQQDINGCFPKGNCNVRDTSFGLLALSKFNKDTLKTKNWLLDASNNFNIGTWTLDIKSNTTNVCVLNGQDINLTKDFSQKITQPTISLDCNKTVNLSLSHTYLGTVYSNLINLNGKVINYKINDDNCFGVSYKSDCDYLSTAYATWILNQIESYNIPEYLITNLSETSTLQHALLYLVNKDQDALNWLLNNKQNEAWGKFSSSISGGQNDIFTSSLVYLSFKDEQNLNDTLAWLKNQININILDASMKLYSTYDDEVLKPIISINPAYIDYYETSLTVENKNNLPVQIDLETPVGVTSDKNSIILTNKHTFSIKIDKAKFSSGRLILKYGSSSYNIPILLEGMIIIDEEEPVLDDTYLEFIGIASQIKETLARNQSKQASVKLRNNQRVPLLDISIEIKGDIQSIINIQNNIQKINPNEVIELNLSINKNKDAKAKVYTGSLIFNNKDFNLELPVNIEIKEKLVEKLNQSKEQVIVEPKKSSKLYWIAPFIVIVLIGIIIFFRTKKPKTESFEDFLKSVQEK